MKISGHFVFGTLVLSSALMVSSAVAESSEETSGLGPVTTFRLRKALAVSPDASGIIQDQSNSAPDVAEEVNYKGEKDIVIDQVSIAARGFQQYVFSQDWLPEFCYSQSYPGCKNPQDQWNSELTIHGLWPEYDVANGGSGSNPGPQNCKPGTFSPGSVDNSVLKDIWPNVKSSANPLSSSYDSFWRDEWDKHGSCSGLSVSKYFQEATRVYNLISTPSIISNNVGGSVSLSQLKSAYGPQGYVAFKCTSGYLVEVRTCWQALNDGTVGRQTACPSFVSSSCPSTVKIASF